MITVLQILAVAALISTIVSMTGRCPLYVPAFLLSVFACLQVIPK